MPTTSTSKMEYLTGKILELSSSSLTHEQIVIEVVMQIQKATEIEAIGLRVADELDYPYYFSNGFIPDFVQKEMYLCAKDDNGEIIRDPSGNSILECMCGNIIRRQTNPSLPFFTKGGSFWTNSTTQLLASTKPQDRMQRPSSRSRCTKMGYESVALIPIKSAQKIYGLIQLNDHRKDMFTVDEICFFEGIGSIVAILFAAIKAKQELEAKTDDIVRMTTVRLHTLEKIAQQIRSGENINQDLPIITKLDSILNEIQVIKGTLPICLTCKKVRTDIKYWENIEGFIMNRTDANFTHTFCPECYNKWRKEEGLE